MMQRSEEWFAARIGKATASCAADIMARVQNGGEAATRRQYRARLVCERMTGVPYDSYTNAAMLHGIEQEPFARAAYEAVTGNLVEEVGFIQHPELAAGASPDGLIDDDGVLELKCPTTGEHIDTVLGGMPAKHIAQIQFQLWITGRKWCDFCSFDPRMPEKLQLYVERVERDDKYIDKLVSAVTQFLDEVDSTVKQLQAKC